MAVHIQLEDRVDGMRALYRVSGNLLLDRVLGAELHPFPEGEDEAAADAAMERRAAALAAEGRKPYVIHSAPGHAPLGGLGYVLAAGEVAEQARDLAVSFDAVVCASGGALTHAGASGGLAGARRAGAGPRHLRTPRRHGPGRPGGAGGGCARADDRTPECVRCGRRRRLRRSACAGLRASSTRRCARRWRWRRATRGCCSTRSAMAGLIAHARAGRIAAGSRVLFIHTGGQPALFAYAGSLGSWLSETPGTPAR